MKRSIAMMAALLVVGLIAGIGPAQAKNTPPAPPAGTKTFEVVTHHTQTSSSVEGAQCWGLTTTPECRVREVGNATFTGTMWGEVYIDLQGYDPSAFPEGKLTYEGTVYIKGGVKGCGTGTYILDVTEGYVDMSKYNPLTDSAPGYNKWQLRPGSGTGELTNLVSASGVTRWKMHLKGFVDENLGDGDSTGTITCRR